MVRLTTLLENIEHFRWRVLQDALNEATADYWRRRAQDFRQVGTPACDEIAEACLNRARIAEIGGAPWADEPTAPE